MVRRGKNTTAHKRADQTVKSRTVSKLIGRLVAIGKDCAARLKEPSRSGDHTDLLYDDKGLPK